MSLIRREVGRGGSISFLFAYNDLLVNEASNDTAAEFVRRRIRATVKDPKTAELLCPTDHPIGTKRLILDTDYYETFNRDNVTLVDARTRRSSASRRRAADAERSSKSTPSSSRPASTR